MIIVMKKSNILLVGLIFLLLVAIYSLNTVTDSSRAASGKGDKKMVILDPGHGGEDPGVVSRYSGLREKDINLQIAMKVKDLLEKEGFNILMTREEDRLEYSDGTTNITEKRRQDLTRRKKIMDESGAGIVVSIHMNGFPETQYSGAQVFYPPQSPDSLKLAGVLQKSIKEIADPNNQRQPMEKKQQIVILKDLKTTTVIVECGFFSNPDEEKKLGTDEYQALLATAIADGIKNYYK